MDRELMNQFRLRIEHAKTAEVAKDIDVDLLMARHDYFGRELCRALNIEYRNDVPLVDILLEIIPDINPMNYEIPNVTPDNFIWDGNTLIILDYKVSVSSESSEITLLKYEKLIKPLLEQIGINCEIAIVRANPVSNQLIIVGEIFKIKYPIIPIVLDFTTFFELKTLLYNKFADDEEFLLKVAHGDFTMTAPWCNEETPELFDHPIYKEFFYSMPQRFASLFLEFLNHSSYGSERWNTLLYKAKTITLDDYNDFLNQHSKNIFLLTGDFEAPTRKEINNGWEQMTERIKLERELTNNVLDAKPSMHFLWSKPSSRNLKDSTAKVIFLSNSLMNISEKCILSETFKALGKCMNLDGRSSEYIQVCEARKLAARSSPKQINNKKLDYVKIGDAFVLWEQQFLLQNDYFKNKERQLFLQKFLGIGGHKRFKDKTAEDIDKSKPKILDFNDNNILLSAKSMFNKLRLELSKPTDNTYSEDVIDKFSQEIKSASEDTFDSYKQIKKSQFWSCISDISTLMKNILSVSQYNRHNTFRVALCANDNLYAIVFPSSDIKTKRATVVFITIAIHKNKDELIDCSSLHTTLKMSNNQYISISKAIRLDKERCQRIVSAPGLFLLSTLLMKNNNNLVNINDVMAFCFLTSLSITKSMLSLTEPSRYMIMNSLAVSSHVREYIAEKFSPYTKTLFSVYMVHLIKKGCLEANAQKAKIELRDVYLSDYDITQKGVSTERNLSSIWFPGQVNLTEYVNQIYLPFYFNAKGLHEKHHVMIDLAKTVLEIEKDQRSMVNTVWSKKPLKQHVNLPILVHSIAKNLILDTSRHNHLRNRVESRNNFKRSITTISTFTSSKSCIKIGEFSDLKESRRREERKNNEKLNQKFRISNPLFLDEEETNLETQHSDYQSLKSKIPNYRDYISTKVFDRLYELLKEERIGDGPFIYEAMNMMRTHTNFWFTFFNKGQKTAKDREIFVGEFEAKMCMYVVERIAKERCKLNTDEMISEPGDSKLRILERKAEEEIRFVVDRTKQRLKAGDPAKALKIEINADMSKWSAQDVFFKYFWLVVMDPILYPFEKQRILYFLCNYMEKSLILPDELLNNLLDQKTPYQDDILLEMTNNLHYNSVKIKRNWLQGNFNYISSYIHSCAMLVYKDVIKNCAMLLEGEVLVNSMVHSDDNQTSITMVQNKLSDDIVIQFSINTFEDLCLTFGCQANMKKTYITHTIKEFVSLFNIHGEPMSIYGRFLLPSVGDCAYIGPYEDLASRLSATQQAIKHGCPPSLAWVAIGCSHWLTYYNYNMLDNQVNSPLPYFPTISRDQIPIELNGLLKSPLYLISLLGLEAGNIEFILKIMRKLVPIINHRETVQTQYHYIEDKINKLDDMEILRLKILRYLTLDVELAQDAMVGETSDMRNRSLLTPRKFTTSGCLNKLISYNDFKQNLNTNEHVQTLQYMLTNPELLVTKGETKEQFQQSILYRYNSKKFKESLSIQTPAQLFIEQILFSHKPIIDYSSIFDKLSSYAESNILEETPKLIGRVTYPQAYQMIVRDLNQLPLTIDDIKIIIRYCILNDPLIIMAANTILLSVQGTKQERTGTSANQMPEFRNMKLIQHSPAIVLRAFSTGNLDQRGADPIELEKDLYHLKEFLEGTGILDKFKENINNPPTHLNSIESINYQLRETTKLYQICYDYIKSTEHKVKIFILPMKSYTAVEFCTLIQGNTISDTHWFTMHYLKQVVSGSIKGAVTLTSTNDQIIASECFKTITHFADYFIEAASRLSFISEIIDNFTYKNVPVKTLYGIVLNNNLKYDFLPLLFRMRDLKQEDLIRFDALKTNERVSWNNWQSNRSLNSGIIDLTISGYMRSIRIVGEDTILKIAELSIPNFLPPTVFHAGSKLLNTRHGLKFEKMQEIALDEKTNYYITCQKKRANLYHYQIMNMHNIIKRNKEGEVEKSHRFNKIIPVCPVVLAIRDESFRLDIDKILPMNLMNYNITKLIISPDETVTIRKAHLSKMQFFDGPTIRAGILNLTMLMKTPELMNLNFDNLCKTNIIPLSRILECDGEEYGEAIFLSDEIMDFTISEEIESMPIFTVRYSKKGDEHMTYKNAITKLISKGIEEFIEIFDFSDLGFYSSKNMGIIRTIVSIINLLDTNEWSTIIKNTIHIAMIHSNLDRQFHLFELPTPFYNNVAGGDINWPKVQRFIISLPAVEISPWDLMMERFKEKTIELVNKEINRAQNFEDFLNELEVEEDRGIFNFF
ncbi:RNA-dependent RNA polymerase [Kairi virus]|uniref:RNA-directed RNA polymerase L n=1 Tax=Kairi virus TaxID=80939 RepID=A0A162HUL0_9VIRU|nr:RNA-dependent RNA polymerase [Kairi virus]ALC78364.1 RNA-dependent RNA polymerase [Kairi virus]